MKLVLVLMLCALAAAAPRVDKPHVVELNSLAENAESRNWIVDQAVNQLVRQLIAYVRRIINNGSILFGIPPLDPLDIEHLHLNVPAGIINLDLDLKNIYASGMGGFVVHKSKLDLSDLSFDLDISVPNLDVSAGEYDLVGDFLGAVPVYGKGKALFDVDEFRLKAKLFLEQSEDGKSVLIGRVENASFELPSFKSGLTGVIGGGDIDAIVNAVIEDVVVDYINRFQGAISQAVATYFPIAVNPMLAELDTWKYIAVLPRPRSA